jgi:DNA-binding NtrC family response regulator
MITAYGDAETRREAVERGAVDVFTKPIDFPELRVVIGRRIEAARDPHDGEDPGRRRARSSRGE